MLQAHRLTVITALAVLAVTIAITTIPAQADERFEQIAQAWFASHNSGDPDVMREFIARYRSAAALEKRPVDERVERRKGMFDQIGAIEPRDILRQTDSTVVYRAFAPKVGMWLEATFKVEVGDEVKLAEVMIRPTKPPADAVATIEWTTTAGLLEKVAAEANVPAVAVAVVDGDEVTDVAAVGVRARGGDPVATDDRWHIGSVAKSVTATMIAALVEAGTLEWDVTLGDALGDIEMRDEYREVTLADLLHHYGGIQPYTNVGEEEEARLAALTGTPTEVRAGFAALVLSQEPVGPRGQFTYSNAGYTLAALMAERATGKPWSELVRVHVFAPAGLEHAGFGWPATPERPDQPRGHFLEGDTLRVQGLDEYPLGDYIDPAGDIHMSIEDMARYARYHLQGLAGHAGGPGADAFAWLHTPGNATAATKYAGGWVIEEDDAMGETHWHNGSAGTFYAYIALYPELGRAVVVATNGGLGRGQAAAQRIVDLLNERAKGGRR